MEYIKQWTFYVCISVVISVIISFISPKGNMGNFMKIVISVFIFVSFVIPFHNFDFKDIKVPNIDITNYTNSNKIAQEMIVTQVKQALEDNKIIGANVDCKLHIDEYNQITIDSVQVAVGDEYNLDEVKRLIYDKLQLNVSVIHIGQ